MLKIDWSAAYTRLPMTLLALVDLGGRINYGYATSYKFFETKPADAKR